MDTPYSDTKKQLEILAQKGQDLIQAITTAGKSHKDVKALQALAKRLLPEWGVEIATIGSTLKETHSIRKQQGEMLSFCWISEITGVVQGLHIGQRRGELRKKTKEMYLKRISETSRKSSVTKRISSGICLINSILADIAAKEVDWRPRGKLIESGRLLEGKDELKKILTQVCQGEILVCDPWCSKNTVALLEAVPPGVSIRLLTVNLKNREEVLSALSDMRRSGRKISLIVLDKKGGALPHDRFIAIGHRVYQVGCSLDQVGMKDTVIGEVDSPHEVRNMILNYVDGRKGRIFERM